MNIIETLFNPLFVLKLGFLIVDLLYIFFLFVLLNRVLSMSKIIREPHDELILRSVATFKILLAISLFLLGLVLL